MNNTIEIKENICDCHPETCNCGKYNVFLNGEKLTNSYDLKNAKALVSQLEKALKLAKG